MNYWKTHNYDPINALYYDKEKEAKYCEEREKLQQTHGKDIIKKLPNIVQKEGMLINPVNN